MKLWRNLLMVVAVLSLVGVVQAQQGAKKTEKKDNKSLSGQVVSATAKEIIIKTRDKGTEAKNVTVVTDDKTKVTLDGKAVKLQDLKAGYRVKVTPATGVAKKIEAKSEKKSTDKASTTDKAKTTDKATTKDAAKKDTKTTK